MGAGIHSRGITHSSVLSADDVGAIT